MKTRAGIEQELQRIKALEWNEYRQGYLDALKWVLK